MSKTAPTSKTQKTDQKTEDTVLTPNSQITVKIAWAIVQPAYEKTLRKLSARVKAPGFRIGKVPASMAEKMIDPADLLDPTIQEVLPDAYTEALKKADKHPISQPEVEPVNIKKGEDWEFTVFFAEKPEIKLGDYKKVVKAALKESESEVAEAVKKAAEKKTSDDKKSTDEKPAEALTDTQKEDIQVRHVFKALVTSIQPKIQELLVRAEVNHDLQHLAEQLQQMKLSIEDYLKSRQVTFEQLRQETAQMGLSRLQLEFILAEVAKDLALKVEEVEIDEQLKKMLGEQLTPEQLQKAEYRSYVFSSLIKQKTLKALLSL